MILNIAVTVYLSDWFALFHSFSWFSPSKNNSGYNLK